MPSMPFQRMRHAIHAIHAIHAVPPNAPRVGANLVFARDVDGEINDVIIAGIVGDHRRHRGRSSPASWAIIAGIVGDHKDRPYDAMISMEIMESAIDYRLL